MRKEPGFTLLELMITISIVGILAMIAVPKFAELMRKSTEGSIKGNLGSVRSALGVYYGDMEGQYPSDLASLTVGARYIKNLPSMKLGPMHAETPAVVAAANADDTSGWLYNNITGAANQGLLMVNCTHTDTKGTTWTSY